MMVTILTPRQIDCLRLLSQGFSSMMIAEDLQISKHTVNKYFLSICRRLNVRNRTQALALAIRLDLI
jgi:DNA-binding CsgD family transcriptional regulator